MGKRIVILGAGFGGLASCTALRKQLGPEHSIVLIERKKSFIMGLVNLWILAGTRKLEESQTPFRNLESRGIDYLNDEVIGIDTASSSIHTTRHGAIKYDFLIIALGSDLAPERVSGFMERGYNLYDPLEVPSLRERLMSFSNGEIAIVIMGMPYKCPPAPFEASMIIEHLLRNNGSRRDASINIYSPAPIALPVAGTEVSSNLVEMLRDRDINFHPSHKLESVSDSELIFAGGKVKQYQVLVGIPQHKVPEVILKSGLAGPNGWVEVDKRTMRTRQNNVFAIGDVTEIRVTPAISVPKAGVFAEAQAKTVAQEIIEELSGGQAVSTFDGRGFCFMENGDMVAGMIEASFYDDPGPTVKLYPPSAHNYERKQDFERTRLNEWFL